MNLFTYITGIATLIGLILQLKNFFPKYERIRKNILYVTIGLFIGTLLGSIKLVQLNLAISNDIDGFIKILISMGGFLILLIVLIAAIFTKNKETKSLMFLIFMIVIFGYGFGMAGLVTSSRFNSSGINLDELKIIADLSEENGNYDRCIEMLEIMKSKVSTSDPRRKAIEKRMEQIKNIQVE
jgi:hypothetical protein